MGEPKQQAMPSTHLYTEEYSTDGRAEAAGHAHSTGSSQHLVAAGLVGVNALLITDVRPSYN